MGWRQTANQPASHLEDALTYILLLLLTWCWLTRRDAFHGATGNENRLPNDVRPAEAAAVAVALSLLQATGPVDQTEDRP